MEIINQKQCKLIGICGPGMDAEVQREWNNRFQAVDTFLVNIQTEDTAIEAAKKITNLIAKQGITTLSGQTILMAVFLDLSKPDAQIPEAVFQTPALLSGALGCVIPMVLEFGFLGEMAFADKVELRNRVRKLIDLNKQDTDMRRQLCLLAYSPLVLADIDKSWKAVMLLLDIMRRKADFNLLIPSAGTNGTNDDIGFLQYAEYNHTAVMELQAEKEKLKKQLGKQGDAAFSKMLQELLDKVESEAKNKFMPDGTMQPIHPGMIVNGAWNQRQAAKGKNQDYENAKRATQLAVQQSAEQLKLQMHQEYKSQLDRAGELLRRLIVDSEMGLGLEEDQTRMRQLLAVDAAHINEPILPSLNYSEAGPGAEISEYLTEISDAEAQRIRQNLAGALLDAYNAVCTDTYAQRRAELEERLRSRNQIQLDDEKAFLNRLQAKTPLPETRFFPALGGGAQFSFAVSRQTAYADAIDKLLLGTPNYYIDEKIGGLKTLDGAPMKALQFLLFDATDQRLVDLIK